MQAFYTDDFVLPLPHGHKFPMLKYQRLREEVEARQLVGPTRLRHPRAARDEDLLGAHTPDYLDRVATGQLTPREVRRIGFPWSPQMVERSRRSVGATIEASQAALTERVGVNLAGGTHHAFADRGEGFCVFNDTIVAARQLQRQGRARRALIVDCDVHQGNGSAALTHGDPTIFTFSMHARSNFPYHKEQSDLDVELEDGTADAEYLQLLADSLKYIEGRFDADFVFYLAGADPFEGDRYGNLALTKSGLAKRDQAVMEWTRKNGLPITVSMAGGYADDVEDIVDIHLETVRIARKCWEQQQPNPSMS